METIGIIGGGASGLVAAITAKSNKNKVIIFERNQECGKKILVTGNGRCNYTNENQNIEYYHSKDKDLIKEIINEKNIKKMQVFFQHLGIVPRIKNGYYYPFSNQASTIKDALVREQKKKQIQIKNNFLVEKIIQDQNKFIVCSKTEKVMVDKLIIATGSKAAPKTGSDGTGYSFLKELGHTIIKPLPALVQLKSNEGFQKDWAGIRTEAAITLYENNQKIRVEQGELQLTDYGVSGICIFNLSYDIARGLDENKEERLEINFLPFLEPKEITSWLEDQYKVIRNKNIQEQLEGVLNKKLVKIILKKSNICPTKEWSNLTIEEKETLGITLGSFPLKIIGTNSFDKAQICSGGVSLKEINLKTMESKKIKNLYMIGELIDLSGDCGGYNLTIAWITGLLSGESCKEIKND